MKVSRNGRFLLVERDENDAPVVVEPYPRPTLVGAKEFNSWRKEYRLSFDNEEDAKKAELKVSKCINFDMAAAWLDKQ